MLRSCKRSAYGHAAELHREAQARGRQDQDNPAGAWVVRRILNLCATEWMDEQGLPRLHRVPRIKLFTVTDGRSPNPLSEEEQSTGGDKTVR